MSIQSLICHASEPWVVKLTGSQYNFSPAMEKVGSGIVLATEGLLFGADRPQITICLSSVQFSSVDFWTQAARAASVSRSS